MGKIAVMKGGADSIMPVQIVEDLMKVDIGKIITTTEIEYSTTKMATLEVEEIVGLDAMGDFHVRTTDGTNGVVASSTTVETNTITETTTTTTTTTITERSTEAEEMIAVMIAEMSGLTISMITMNRKMNKERMTLKETAVTIIMTQRIKDGMIIETIERVIIRMKGETRKKLRERRSIRAKTTRTRDGMIVEAKDVTIIVGMKGKRITGMKGEKSMDLRMKGTIGVRESKRTIRKI